MQKKQSKGFLFIFEGPDGVGKTTIAKAVYEHLKELKYECSYLSFPGKEKFTLGALVYELHHGGLQELVTETSPLSLQSLHIAAHLDAIEKQIKPLLSKGHIIILDRFWWSTYVYGTCNGIESDILTSLITAEKKAWKPIKPEIVFLISRNKPFRDDSKSWHKINKSYLEFISSKVVDSSVKIVKNENDLNSTVSEILAVIKGKIQDRNSRFHIISKLAPAKPTKLIDAYWRFAAERQEIFFKRLYNTPPPWTIDPVLSQYKFTNTYRASDRVSQYLIKDVIYKGDTAKEEVLFRILVFKLFNKIETWEYLTGKLGEITFKNYTFKKYDGLLTKAIESGKTIYSSAYIMPSGSSSFGNKRKHRNHLMLIEKMMRDELASIIVCSRAMKDVFEVLLGYPTLGEFLAYQLTIDINYSTLCNFSEMDFVVPGPGALSGIRKCFSDLGGLNESEIIKVVTEMQEQEFDRLGIKFRSLWGRPLQLIDCQNLFCEIDKYSRVAFPEMTKENGRTRIKQKYKMNDTPISFMYPPKWNINEKITHEVVNVPV